MSDAAHITSTDRSSPPRWALLQRELITRLEEAAEEFVDRYTRGDRTLIWRSDWPGMDGSDDPYEAFHNLVLLYVLGGNPRMLELGEAMWEAITWQWTQYGQIHDEFDGYYDWMHHGESSHLLYFTGLARPGSLKWKQRATKLADLYAGPQAHGVNYDPVHKIIRSPLTGSRGPRFTVTAEDWVTHRPILKDTPFDDIDGAGVAFPWLDDSIFEQILQRFNERVTRGDVPVNLHATALATHAYMFTGDDRYRDWALEYVHAWTERTRANGGIAPDNVGLNGVVGEHNDGKWWGGYYGWQWPRGLKDILEGLTNAAMNATLLSGDSAFLELPRMQIDSIWDLRRRDDTGGWLLPSKHRDSGWTDYQLPPHVPFIHLWNTSVAEEDAERIDRLELPSSWTDVTVPRTSGYDPDLGRDTKHLIANTHAWYRYIRGHNAHYPEAILRANLDAVARQTDRMRSAAGDPHTWDVNHPYSIHMWQEMCPVVLEGLAQLTLGSPMHMSHGGLQHAKLRYYDGTRRRPGLPPHVSALVSAVSADAVTLELVNTSDSEDGNIIVQAGGFGEHHIADVTARDGDDRVLRKISDVGNHLTVHLGARAAVTLDIGLRRYTRQPTYASPWTDPHAMPVIVPRDPDAVDLSRWAHDGAYGPPTVTDA
ncbi:hypothetical protein [Phytoactinopolyspora endophytica]|uniref:hypothetical protein n=1 Tax=Phytoactinopolyspora endophytica TaxID=1642495 RepID=UPI00101D11C6|nr:hypothetical protein [Phytoactinopolyspora endophytica]